MTSIVRLGRYELVLLKTELEAPSLWGRLRALLLHYRKYRAIARQRKQLAQLPDYLLKDIGVSRADALHEANKPFWK